MPVNPGVEKSWIRESVQKKKKKKVSFPISTDPKGGAKFTTSTETSVLRQVLPYKLIQDGFPKLPESE